MSATILRSIHTRTLSSAREIKRMQSISRRQFPGNALRDTRPRFSIKLLAHGNLEHTRPGVCQASAPDTSGAPHWSKGTFQLPEAIRPRTDAERVRSPRPLDCLLVDVSLGDPVRLRHYSLGEAREPCAARLSRSFALILFISKRVQTSHEKTESHQKSSPFARPVCA